MIKCEYVPVVASIWLLFTFFITYIIAVLRKDVPYFLPYISEAGTFPPESCVFGQLMNLGALIMLFGICVRYCQVKHDIKTKNIRLHPKWNTVSLKLGAVGSLGISMVGNFQESNMLGIHLVGAIMAIGVSSAYLLLQTKISYAYLYARTRSIPKWLFYLRLLLSVPLIPMLIAVLILGGLALAKFTGNSKRWWTEEDGGYTYRIASALLEWILAIMIFLYVYTFKNEMGCIEFEGVCFKINDRKQENDTTENNGKQTNRIKPFSTEKPHNH
uniref:CWH43-like N-terminal domain-containing protein n=2 Tax=Photinus pyralis TaxID=7054 RepID=A0A1Y1K3H6_PHOPY